MKTANELSNEIVEMSQAWYEYVNLDHHKDRDCHFFVEATFSYGDHPLFTAYHEGYVGERWYGPKRVTVREALEDLHGFLLGTIRSQIAWVDGRNVSEGWSVDRADILRIFAKWADA